MSTTKVIVEMDYNGHRSLFMIRTSDQRFKNADVQHVTDVIEHRNPARRGSIAVGRNGVQYLVYGDGSARVWKDPGTGPVRDNLGFMR